jgi:hypothetical protein
LNGKITISQMGDLENVNDIFWYYTEIDAGFNRTRKGN